MSLTVLFWSGLMQGYGPESDVVILSRVQEIDR
jgi:hypothetical protein